MKPVRTTKPSYYTMIRKAMVSLNPTNRARVSVPAISKYIRSQYPVGNPHTFHRYLRRAIRNAVRDRKLVKVLQSYRLKKSSPASSTKKTSTKLPRKRLTTKPTTTSASLHSGPSVFSPSVIKKQSESKKSRTNLVASNRLSTTKKPRASSTPSHSKLPAIAVGTRHPFVWQYFDKMWKNYDVAASDTVEDTYLKYLANKGDTDVRAVHSGEWEYQVDFLALKQTNIGHSNHTVRSIRRSRTVVNNQN